jgi:hypothetical protein
MKPDEVVRFIAYIIDLHNMPGIKTKEAYDDWHKAFKDITFDQGKKIVAMFGKENTDKPTLPALVKIRDYLFPPVVSGSAKCELCNSTGAIFVEKRIVTNENNPSDDVVNLYVYRCTCSNGQIFHPTAPLISNDIVRGKHRDISNIWRIDQPSKRHGDSEKVDAAEVREMLAEVATQGEI